VYLRGNESSCRRTTQLLRKGRDVELTFQTRTKQLRKEKHEKIFVRNRAGGPRGHSSRSANQSARRAARWPAALASPEVHADRTVTFRVRAPNASNVTVSGEWAGGAKPMTKDDRGIWSATFGPLAADLYSYNFSIDGFATADPNNSVLKPMRVPTSSVLDVPADKPQLWDVQPVPHGVVRLHEYKSKSLGKRRPLRVYTPPGYDQNTRTKYPILYLFHGSGDNEVTWTAFGHANLIIDNLLAQGKAKPMIVVMPDGHAAFAQPAGTNTDARARNNTAFERDLLEDVMQFAEKNYRVKAGRENRAIIGLSLGGGQSLSVGLGHLELFAWVGGMSSAGSNTQSAVASLGKDPKAANKNLKLLWIACGKSDSLLASNRQLDETLTQSGIKHEFRVSDGAHAWPVWRRYLGEFVPLLFMAKR
jgi:enterochelin esterase-like enzyme